MAGRKPLPTNVKKFRGNPGKRPLNEREPSPPPAIPQCPPNIKGAGRKEWKRITVELAKLELISEMDKTALAVYCDIFNRWIEASAKLREFGMVVVSSQGFPMQSPYMSIVNKCLDQMRQYLTEFGMTPSSRSRLVGAVKPESDDDDQRFFGRKKPTG